MVTKQDCMNAQYGDHFRYLSGTYSRSKELKQVRVSGKCKTWKTRPDDFQLPVKYGMYESLYITPDNAALFITEQEYQKRKEQAQAVGQVLTNPIGRKLVPTRIGAKTDPTSVTISRKNEFGEYVVRLWKNGKHYKPADYFTNDADDAEATAKMMFDKAVATVNEMAFEPHKRLSQAEMLKNPTNKRRLIEIAQQAGMLGWHVFVDGMYDADIPPSKTAGDAMRKALRAYPRTGQHKNLDYSYYTGHDGMLKNPSNRYFTESTELANYAVNNAELYRSRIQPIILNLQRKIKRGVYDHALALKLWKYAADDAAQRYTKEYGSVGQSSYGIFTVPMRMKAAELLRDYYTEQVNKFKRNPGTLRATRKRASKMHSRTHFDTAGGVQKTVSVQQQRGAMWFTLAVAKNTDQGRKLAQQWALRYHRKHPGTKLRLFV